MSGTKNYIFIKLLKVKVKLYHMCKYSEQTICREPILGQLDSIDSVLSKSLRFLNSGESDVTGRSLCPIIPLCVYKWVILKFNRAANFHSLLLLFHLSSVLLSVKHIFIPVRVECMTVILLLSLWKLRETRTAEWPKAGVSSPEWCLRVSWHLLIPFFVSTTFLESVRGQMGFDQQGFWLTTEDLINCSDWNNHFSGSCHHCVYFILCYLDRCD